MSPPPSGAGAVSQPHPERGGVPVGAALEDGAADGAGGEDADPAGATDAAPGGRTAETLAPSGFAFSSGTSARKNDASGTSRDTNARPLAALGPTPPGASFHPAGGPPQWPRCGSLHSTGPPHG